MKRHSTTKTGPEFKKKNSEGRSHKHVDGPRHHDSGGDHENHHAAKRHNRGGPNKGPEVADRQAPHKQREVKEQAPRGQSNSGLDGKSKRDVDAWCRGMRSNYK